MWASQSCAGAGSSGWLRGKYTLADHYDLRQATLAVDRLLFEPGNTGKAELVQDENAAPVPPLVLTPNAKAKSNRAVFETPEGIEPRVKIRLKLRDKNNPWDIVQPTLKMTVKVDSTRMDVPALCELGEASALRGTQVRLTFGDDAEEPLASQQIWNCRTRPDGTVKKLKAVKAPPVKRPPPGQ